MSASEKGKDVNDLRMANALPADLAGAAATVAYQETSAAGVSTNAAKSDENQPILICAKDVVAKPLVWTWPRYLPQGKLTCWIGDPGLGKSLITLDIAARVSAGSKWPDGSGGARVGSVILLSAEDDPADTLKPRLMAADADLAKVHFLTMVAKPDGTTASFTLGDLKPLELALRSVGDCRLVIIDPVTCFLAGKDSHVNAEVRELLAPLADLAARFEVAVLFVTHRPKGATPKAVHAASGSLAFTAAARFAVLVAKDPKDDDRRLVLPVKSNLSVLPEGLAYAIEQIELDGIGFIPRLKWDADSVNLTADELLAAEAMAAKGNVREQRRNEADAFLRDLLADGRVASTEVLTKAENAGIGGAAIRSAYRRLGGIPSRKGFQGTVYWELPDPPTGPADPGHTFHTSYNRAPEKTEKYEAEPPGEEGLV